MLNRLLFLGFVGVLILSLFSSCRNENFYTGDDIKPRTDLDTIRFDTVFTTIGSTTKFFKLFNDQPGTIIIDEISLADESGFFRLNINGESVNKKENIELAAFDSLYVFVEVTVDPDLPESFSPFVIEDRVDINVGGETKKVCLEAWGQNANYIPNKYGSSKWTYISCDFDDFVWDDPKPYVIYGSLLVDSCTIVIPEGKEVYVHGGIAINDLGIYQDGQIRFLRNGKIKTQGTIENPVSILSTRREEDYLDRSGQWAGFLFFNGSSGNEFNNTIIRNSVIGARVDSLAVLSLKGSEIGFTSGTALIGRHGNIYAENSLFHNNGISGMELAFGGNYEFNNCTIVNYDNQDEAIKMSNFQCIDQLCLNEPLRNDLKATFRNCLILGNDNDEISLNDWDPESPEDFDYNFDHCFVQVDELLDADAYPNFFENCNNCLNNPPKDTLFIDMDLYDFHLDTMSRPIDAGRLLPFLTIDKDGVPRNDGSYDVGCYEFTL